ncbi:carboxypeptidase-like regulatory domain-containing protein [Segetibacter sp. 3557_3]|uniref:carboxypeptidase-like regulatory domain-containing protein n=1 Tax=Segetibacter sp. 3557_3 TaxID=2547429 RepID=UPI001404F468|nr:carboxypeptidase-like regulatory domain-containing protein [Segetibacter sp. 3557_3]
MFTKLVAVLSIVALFSQTVAGQDRNGILRGMVVGEHNHSIDGASISRLRAADKVLVKAAIPDEGKYMFEKLAVGKYRITISAVGLASYISEVVDVATANASISLPNVTLKTAGKTLATVQVTSTRPLIENKIDKTVVNVEAAVTNAGT